MSLQATRIRDRAGLVALGVAALALWVGVTIWASGGGIVEAAGLIVRLRRPWGALGLAGLAGACACLCLGWRGVAAQARRLWCEPGRVPALVAAGAAAVAGGVGLLWGTRAASGADAYGYVSQAVMWAGGHLSLPLPVAGMPWPDAAWTWSPFGWRPAFSGGGIVPTYAPGLPLLMAPLVRVFGDSGAYVVVPLAGSLAVWWTWRLGRQHLGPWGAATAAVLVAASPAFVFQIVQPMSDVPVTAWWTGALVYAWLGHGGRAGACTAAAVLTRPNLAPLAGVIAVAVWVAERDRAPIPGRRWRRGPGQGFTRFVAAAVPGVCVWLLTNRLWYGHILASGYGALGDLFHIDHVWPNTVRYARWFAETHRPLLWLAAASPLVMALGARAGAPGVPGSGNAAGPERPRSGLVWTVSAGMAALTVLAYLPYGQFDEWTYLRFLLPALPCVAILAAGVAVTAADRLPKALGGVSLIVILAVATGSMVDAARAGQAFQLRRLEARYAGAGHEAAQRLPAHVVFLAVQQSGSLRHYARRPTLRWDLLDPSWFERALAALTAQGYAPVFVLEAWEEPQFRQHLGTTSVLGRLDWPPAIEIDGTPKVRIYVPGDRATFLAGGDVRTQRVHPARRR